MNQAIAQAEMEAMVSRHSFRPRLIAFIAMAQSVIDNHYASMGFHTKPPTLKMSEGPRYVRVYKEGPGERSVYCFVDQSSGDILKAAGWLSPAKGARANIWDEDLGRSGITAYGGKYFR